MLTQVWAACKRGVRAVNVFKKKNCGASPVTAKPVITERMLLDHAARLLGLP